MDFLRRHWEKLALGLMLLGLLVSILLLLISIKGTRKRVVDVKRETEQAVQGGKKIDLIKVSEFDALNTLRDPGIVLSILPKEISGDGEPTDEDKEDAKGSLLEPISYIRCANPACMNLIPFHMDTCPYCKTEQPPIKSSTGGYKPEDDEDGDGIPDFTEKNVPFLNPKDPSDALRDQDRDTFTNIEEFTAETEMNDPSSFPELGNNLRLYKVYRRQIPILLKRISRNQSDEPDRWDISFTVPVKGKMRTKMVRLGDEVGGFKVTAAKFVKDAEGKDVAEAAVTEVASENQYTLQEGKPEFEKTDIASFVFLNVRNRKYFRKLIKFSRREGDTFDLVHRMSRTLQKYRVVKIAEGEPEVGRGGRSIPTWVVTVQRIDAKKEAAKGEEAGEGKNGEDSKEAEIITVPKFDPRKDLLLEEDLRPVGTGMGQGMEGEMMPGMMTDPGMMRPGRGMRQMP